MLMTMMTTSPGGYRCSCPGPGEQGFYLVAATTVDDVFSTSAGVRLKQLARAVIAVLVTVNNNLTLVNTAGRMRLLCIDAIYAVGN